MHNRKLKIKITIFSMLTVFLAITIFSCKKENSKGTGPVISLKTVGGYIYKDDTVMIGKLFKVGIMAEKGDANITNFIMKISNDSTFTYLDTGMNVASFSISKTVIKGLGKKDTWTFIVYDKSGNHAEISLNIYADTSSMFGPVTYIPSVIMGAQNNSTVGSFLDIKNVVVYSLADAFAYQDSVELCYYYDFLQGENNVIASPNANIDASVYTGTYGLVNWTAKNETRYIATSLTDTDFDHITNDSLLIVTWNETSSKRKAKNLVAGNIYEFRTAQNKLGVFEVMNVTGTDAGTVEIKVKVQSY